jgi:hypothetical protein
MATLSAISPPSPAPPSNASCLTGATYRPGINFENGKDLKGIPGTTPENCAAACCADATCGHFVYTPFQPGGVDYGKKVRGMHSLTCRSHDFSVREFIGMSDLSGKHHA